MKKWCLVFVLLLICPLFLINCAKNEEWTKYTMNIDFDLETKSMSVQQSVDYVNKSENAFASLYFHLYPNAFREEAKERVVSLANQEKAYPNGLSYGNVEIMSVSVGDTNAEFCVQGEDQNILKIDLKNQLFPNERVKVNMEYVVNLPNINHRFGYGDSTINLANFYPIACVYEEGVGFKQDLYASNGDPFYSDIACYDVTVSYDDSLSLASSGELLSQRTRDGKMTAKISGSKIRDFAMVLSQKFSKFSTNVNGTTLNYFSITDETPNETLDFASKVFLFYNEKFGKYPYKTLTIVQNDFVYGGMEFPNLVMINSSLEKSTSQYVVAHELAHQWWYGVVGNDEFNEAWVDEALTEYSTLLFYEKNEEFGLNYQDLIDSSTQTFNFFCKIYKSVCGEVDVSMQRNLREFDTEPEYVHTIYTQGTLMYDALRTLIGEKTLYNCMCEYYEKMAFKNSSGAELIAIFSKKSGKNLENFFQSFLEGRVVNVGKEE